MTTKALATLDSGSRLRPSRRFGDRFARAADIVAEILRSHGIDRVFLLPGGMIAPVVDSLSHSKIKVTVVRHEAQAVFMAIGHARLTGRPGVVVVTSGPGLTNTMTAVASAMADSVPLLVIAGEVQREAQGKGALQEGSAHHLNLLAAFKPITKYAVEIPEKSAVALMLVEALRRSTLGRPGPVLVTVPVNVSASRTNVPEWAHGVVQSFEIEESAIERAAAELSSSRSKLLFAGNGMRWWRGPDLLRQVAERLQCPVMTTPKGKGVFPEDHPLHVGVFGMGGHPSATEYLETGVEVIVALGTSLGDLQTNSWSDLLRPQRTFIHVDVDGSRIGRAYETHLGIIASAEAFLNALLSHLPRAPSKRHYFPFAHHIAPEEAPPLGPQGRVSPIRAIAELQALLPTDTIYTVDSGQHYFFATHYIKAIRPDTFFVMTGLGSMGSSVGAAIGASIAKPERRVCVVCGDGGFAMMATELETAVRERLPLIVAVFNDQCLGMVRLGHQALFGRSPNFDVEHLDVVGLANSVGCATVRIEHPEQIRLHREAIIGRSEPVVLDIHIDPDVVLPNNSRFETIADVTQLNDARR